MEISDVLMPRITDWFVQIAMMLGSLEATIDGLTEARVGRRIQNEQGKLTVKSVLLLVSKLDFWVQSRKFLQRVSVLA